MEKKPDQQPLISEFGDAMAVALPLIASVLPFALLWGTLAQQAGLSALETGLMSGLVFAGSAQFVATGIWTTPPAVATLVLAVFIVNLRHVLMGAALAPAIRSWGGWRSHLALFFMADEVWALALQRRAQRGLTPGFYFSVGVVFYLCWVASTQLGYRAGSWIPDPAAYGFDFAFAAVFLCLVRSFYVSWRSLLPWVASAAVASLSYSFIEGVWYILLGGLAGALVGLLLPPPRPAHPETVL